MPVVVEKKADDQYHIVEPDTGRVVGKSDNRRDAEISAHYRNKAYEEKQKQMPVGNRSTNKGRSIKRPNTIF